MEWFNSLFSGDLSQGLLLTLVFGALLIALLLVFWLFRKIFGNATTRMNKSRQPRLSVTDAAVVDDKRRLILVRRDNVEHLVMIGGPSDIVIEQAIVRTAPVAIPKPAAQKPAEPAEPVAQTKNDGFFSKPAAAAGAGLATGAASVVATTETAANAASQTVEKAADSVSASAEKTIDTGSQVLANTTDNIKEGAAQITQTATASIFDPAPIPEPELKPEPAVAEPQAQAIPEVAKTEDVSLDFTDDLEDALGLESADEPATGDHRKSSKTEDEMQRLLDDLAAGN